MTVGSRPEGRGAPRLVIFDCDGVLVDSEPIAMATLLDVIGRAGVTIPEEEAYERFLGRSLGSIRDLLAAEFGLVMTPAHLEALRRDLYRRFREELRPVPGIADALARLAVPFCVASSSQVERIRLCLSVTGLIEAFEGSIFSASMVPNGKPAPDLFLHAALMMDTNPSDCLVIEDSPAGVEAARSAGMDVFAFTGGAHAGRPAHRRALAALGPDRIFDDMGALLHLIGDLEAARAGR